MIDTVVTLATNYGHEQPENIIGTISSVEAKAALHSHNGDVWAAATECIRQRQRKVGILSIRNICSSAQGLWCDCVAVCEVNVERKFH